MWLAKETIDDFGTYNICVGKKKEDVLKFISNYYIFKEDTEDQPEIDMFKSEAIRELNDKNVLYYKTCVNHAIELENIVYASSEVEDRTEIPQIEDSYYLSNPVEEKFVESIVKDMGSFSTQALKTLSNRIRDCHDYIRKDFTSQENWYNLWLALGSELSNEIDFDVDNTLFNEENFWNLMEKLIKFVVSKVSPPGDSRSFLEALDRYGYSFIGEFEIYKWNTDPVKPSDVIHTLYKDPIISRMDGIQLCRVADWIPFRGSDYTKRKLSIYEEENKCFVKVNEGEVDELEDEDQEESKNHVKPPEDAVWRKIDLIDLMNQVPISLWYVQEYSDRHYWVSMVEIGENDDYQT